jgi:hypothetical protein
MRGEFLGNHASTHRFGRWAALLALSIAVPAQADDPPCLAQAGQVNYRALVRLLDDYVESPSFLEIPEIVVGGRRTPGTMSRAQLRRLVRNLRRYGRQGPQELHDFMVRSGTLRRFVREQGRDASSELRQSPRLYRQVRAFTRCRYRNREVYRRYVPGRRSASTEGGAGADSGSGAEEAPEEGAEEGSYESSAGGESGAPDQDGEDERDDAPGSEREVEASEEGEEGTGTEAPGAVTTIVVSGASTPGASLAPEGGDEGEASDEGGDEVPEGDGDDDGEDSDESERGGSATSAPAPTAAAASAGRGDGEPNERPSPGEPRDVGSYPVAAEDLQGLREQLRSCMQIQNGRYSEQRIAQLGQGIMSMVHAIAQQSRGLGPLPPPGGNGVPLASLPGSIRPAVASWRWKLGGAFRGNSMDGIWPLHQARTDHARHPLFEDDDRPRGSSSRSRTVRGRELELNPTCQSLLDESMDLRRLPERARSHMAQDGRSSDAAAVRNQMFLIGSCFLREGRMWGLRELLQEIETANVPGQLIPMLNSTSDRRVNLVAVARGEVEEMLPFARASCERAVRQFSAHCEHTAARVGAERQIGDWVSETLEVIRSGFGEDRGSLPSCPEFETPEARPSGESETPDREVGESTPAEQPEAAEAAGDGAGVGSSE